MNQIDRIEKALHKALDDATRQSPPKLKAAMRAAVFPGGGRIRPRLLTSVAEALGDPDPAMTDAAGAALELLHCASLVHDDMPCFDDADLRRGRPTVHKAFGEEIALLTGDALIIEAFALLARAGASRPERLGQMLALLAGAVNGSTGIVAGQAWESERVVDVDRYHRAKTGALFEAATMLGALAAGAPPEPWRNLGALIGEAYQTADDILDAVGDAESAGKPVGQDEHWQRPSVVEAYGLDGAIARLDTLVERAGDAVPAVGDRERLVGLVAALATRLCPPELRAHPHIAARRRALAPRLATT